MTDKQPITEDDIERDTEMGTLVVNYDKFAKEDDEWTEAYYRCKKQILDGQKALEELPMTQIKNITLQSNFDTISKKYDTLLDENQKLKTELAELLTNYSQDKLEIQDLKAEIEELKRQLQK